MTECKRCHAKSSVFWWRHALGVDSDGNNGTTFIICDDCMQDLLSFMSGHVVNDMVIVSRGERE